MILTGPYTIGVDEMAFGKPTRYIRLDPSKIANRGGAKSVRAAWDACVLVDYVAVMVIPFRPVCSCVDKGCDVYSRRMHNICCDNCHSHVARWRYGVTYSLGRGLNLFLVQVPQLHGIRRAHKLEYGGARGLDLLYGP
jgi:hypothetical protein